MKKILVIAVVALLFVMATSTGAMAKEDKITDTLKLKQGYRLHFAAVDDTGEPAKVIFNLTGSNGDIIDSVIISDEGGFNLCDGDIKIVEVKSIQVFEGIESWAVTLNDLVQYNNKTGKIISEIDKTVLIKPC